MAVKYKQCLNQFHSMINICHFNKSVVYRIVIEKKRCAELFSYMVVEHCRTETTGLPPYLDKNSALVLKIDMTTVSRNF